MTKLRNKKATWNVYFTNGYYDAKNKKDAIQTMLDADDESAILSKSYSQFVGTPGKEFLAYYENGEIFWY